MSAPQTNVETQKRWHRGPIIGMVLVVLFALCLLFWQMMTVAETGKPAGNGVDEIDGRTGAPIPGTAEPGGKVPDGDPQIPQDGDVPAETPPAIPVPVPNTDAQP